MNNFNVIGNLVADPNVRLLEKRLVACSFRIANNTPRKDKGGRWGQHTNYFDITVFGSQGEYTAKNFKKAHQVAISGKIEYREWKNSRGEKCSRYVVIADKVTNLTTRTEQTAVAAVEAVTL